MDMNASDRCGFCWSLLADDMSSYVIHKMDRVFILCHGLDVADAEV